MDKNLLILAILLLSILATAYVIAWQYNPSARAEYAGVDAGQDPLLIVVYTASIILSMALIRRIAEKKEGYKELYEHRKILLARKAFLLGKARTE